MNETIAQLQEDQDGSRRPATGRIKRLADVKKPPGVYEVTGKDGNEYIMHEGTKDNGPKGKRSKETVKTRMEPQEPGQGKGGAGKILGEKGSGA